MPAKSKKQLRTMQAAEHNPEIAARLGIPQSVASEFVDATPASVMSSLPESKSGKPKRKRKKKRRKKVAGK